jgi:hypothetical protein
MENDQIGEIHKHISGIEDQIDGITNVLSTITAVIPTHSNQIVDSGVVVLNLSYEYPTVEEYVGVTYLITAFLSLCNRYIEQIDYHTKEICKILSSEVDQNTIDSVYANIAGRFFLPDEEFHESLYDLSLVFLNNKRNRFESVYSSEHYSPKGTKYLKTIYGFLKNYWTLSEPIMNYLNSLKALL